MNNQGKVILVVEDELDIADLLELILTEEGYQVTKTASALEALKLLDNEQIHLITLDLNLLDIDGNEFLRRLNQVGSAIPVVVVTANLNKLKPSNLVKQALQKPFDLDILLKTIDTILA